MEEFRDYTIRNGLGIRVWGRSACRVIRLQHKEWVEIGKPYPIPVDRQTLVWTESGIPASILAVALRVYELDHPGSDLRAILADRKPERKTRLSEPVLAMGAGRQSYESR